MSLAVATNTTIPTMSSATQDASIFEADRSPAIPSLQINDMAASEGAEETREESTVPPRSPARFLAAAAASIQESASSPSRQQQSWSSSHQQQPPTVFRKKATSVLSRFLSTPRRASTASSNSSTSQMSDSQNPGLVEQSQPIEEQALDVAPPVARTSFLARPVQKHHHHFTSSAGSTSSLWSTPWKRLHRASTPRTISPSSVGSYWEGGSSEEIVLFEAAHSSSRSIAMDGDKTKRIILANQKPKNAMQWMNNDCPTDVLPHILAFCGPQTTNRLGQVNKFWRRTVQEEGTWKVLCQELYKWKPGDKEPASWKEHYRKNPCVPVDYKTIQSALNAFPMEESIHIWVRPGRYYLQKPLVVDRSSQSRLSLSTMKMPENIFQAPVSLLDDTPESSTSKRSKKKRRVQGIMKFIRCTSAFYNDAAVDDESICSDMSEFDNSSALLSIPQRPLRATLVYRTRKQNEAAVCVRQGSFSMKHMNVEHSSHGTDIWNGNAAIHVQPPALDSQDAAALLGRRTGPVARFSGLRVTSASGRGLVCVDGGQMSVDQCRVFDCAATGIYVGGRGSRARVTETDVLRNGLGSRISSRRNTGIARGHSGVYLEQGVAELVNCNISNNTLSGITAISTENSTLNLHESDLRGNGTYQLEIPSRDSRNINMSQNRLESQGTGRIRAALPPR